MLLKIVFFSMISGVTVFLGGLLSYYCELKIKDESKKELLRHFLIALGTGVMLSAVCFVLIPEGLKDIDIISSSLIFFLGAICFYLFDKYIENKSNGSALLSSMLLDFIPESIALGVMFVYDPSLGMLLALFIALQNFPESFNSYIELRQNNFSKKRVLTILFFLSFMGLIFSLLGYFFLKESMYIVSALMLFSSGGILYLIFQDIAPSLSLKNNKAIVLGVNLGFIIGILGQAI